MRKKCMFFFFLLGFSVLFANGGDTEKKKNSFAQELKKLLPDSLVVSVISHPLFGIDSSLVKWKKEIRERAKERKRKKKKINPYNIFFTDSSVLRGREYMKMYKGVLDSAYRKDGVPPNITTAILRIESDLGDSLGNFSAPNTFFTLYALYSKTLKTKKSHVKQFAALVGISQDLEVDIFSIKSSWAGAIAKMQFMPLSFHLAVDGDGDGVIDPFTSDVDAIFSITNYLSENGWKKGNWRAVYRYNRSKRYVNAVFKYSTLLEE